MCPGESSTVGLVISSGNDGGDGYPTDSGFLWAKEASDKVCVNIPHMVEVSGL